MPTFLQDEPLEAWILHHRDILHNRAADLHAPEALAHHADAQPLVASLDAQDLQDGAAGDEGVDVTLLHHDRADAELAEVGERGATQAGRVREFPEADVEADEGADAEERGRERHIARPRSVDEDELVDALGSEELEPAREPGLLRAHVAAREVDAAEVSRGCRRRWR